MIPLVLVTGFLGSGKTTLLRNLASAPEGRDLVFLVNEFADLDIDGSRVRDLAPEVFEVTGGSLFCECKVADFTANLEAIHAHFERSGRRLQGAVIETSGIADPEVMAKLLRDTGLSRRFRIARIVALVAPYRFEAYLKAYPNLEAQIRASDVVVINKVDTADDATLNAVERLVREVKAEVRIERTTYARIDFDLWQSPGAYRETGQLSACANPYASLVVRPEATLSDADLRQWCEAHADRILRLKGRLSAGDQGRRIDFSHGRFSAEPEGGLVADPHFVLIVAEKDEAWAVGWKERFEGTSLHSESAG